MLLGKTLYINTHNTANTGASVISERNYELVSLNSSVILTYSLSLTLRNIKRNLKSILLNFSLVNKDDISIVIEQIRNNDIETVFFDTSLLGNVAEEIKATFPNIYIISFFHNVEYDYFKELIKVSKKIQHFFTLKLIKKAESQLIRSSDVIITLNERDSMRLKKVYHRKADLILPTSFKDNYNQNFYMTQKNKSEILNLLFVGSYFPPNAYAVDWFIDNVLSKIKRRVKFFIVGNGFESHKFNQNDERIAMIGKVENTSEYYYVADLVIAPIFHGSGMKTKVAEALMYNKKVIGTQEAFEGYEIDVNAVGARCDSSKEFIDYIENFQPDNSNIRDIFLNNYNFEKIKNNFYNFLNDNRR